VSAIDRSSKEARSAAKNELPEKYSGTRSIRPRPELHVYEGSARTRLIAEQARAPGTVFSGRFIVRTLAQESGRCRELDLCCAPHVAQRWREAILTQVSNAPEPVRKLLSGHDHDGAPLDGPHLAFLPLAFVGHPDADGHLLGMGLVLPEAIRTEERRCALSLIARIDRLLLGRLGVWRIGSVHAAAQPWNLHPEAWTAHPNGATHWSTVTPIAFDRHPKAADRVAYQMEVAEMIARGCVRIGLPRPKEVIVTSASAHLGVTPAHAFPRLERKDGGRRRHAHAILVFEEPVRGPILIGAGRFRGYGVCRPIELGNGGGDAGTEDVAR
jgi:CRISPR-associated protein Csb2